MKKLTKFIQLQILGIVIITTLLFSLFNLYNLNHSYIFINNLSKSEIHNISESLDSYFYNSFVKYLESGVDIQIGYAKLLETKIQNGELTKEEALNKFREFSNKLKFGKTGYAYSIDTKGILVAHPKLVGKDVSKYDFIQKILATKKGAIFYTWEGKEKLVVYKFFSPWGLYLTAGGYVEDFLDIIQLKDLKQFLKDIKMNKDKFIFFANNDGIILYPDFLTGKNINNDANLKNLVSQEKDTLIKDFSSSLLTNTSKKFKIYINHNPQFKYTIGLVDFETEIKNFTYKVVLFTIIFSIILLITIILYIQKRFITILQKDINEILNIISGTSDDIRKGILNKKLSFLGFFKECHEITNAYIDSLISLKAILNYTNLPLLIFNPNSKEITYLNKPFENEFNINKNNANKLLNIFDKKIISQIEILHDNEELEFQINNQYYKVQIKFIYENNIHISTLCVFNNITTIKKTLHTQEKIMQFLNNEIENLSQELEKLANGYLNFKYKIMNNSQDEEINAVKKTFSLIENSLNNVRDNLQKLIIETKNELDFLQNIANNSTNISHQVVENNLKISELMTTITEQTNNLTDAISNLASALEEMSINSKNVASESEKVTQNITSVSGAIEEMSVQIKNVLENTKLTTDISTQTNLMAQQASEKIETLGKDATEIGKVTDVIKRIAEQTNLLALNATIEAASAGEAGKGFAVVANEIKELANQSAKAAEDIAEKINNIQNSTFESVEVIKQIKEISEKMLTSIEEVANNMEEQNKAVEDIANNTINSSSGVQTISNSINEIATAVQEASESITRISENLNEFNSMVQQTNSLAVNNGEFSKQLQQNIEDLLTAMNKINDLINQFKV